MDGFTYRKLIDAARATLKWARTPGNHGGGNPYVLAHVIAAERAIAEHEERAPEEWALIRSERGSFTGRSDDGRF